MFYSYTYGALLVLGFPLLIGAWIAALKFFFRVTAETAFAAFVATLFCFALLLAFVSIHGYLRQAADDREIPCACDEAPTQLLGEEHRADDETIQQ